MEEYILNELALHSVEYQLYSTVRNLEYQFLICHNANAVMITSVQPEFYFLPSKMKVHFPTPYIHVRLLVQDVDLPLNNQICVHYTPDSKTLKYV